MKYYLAIRKEHAPDRGNTDNSQKWDPEQKKSGTRLLILYDSADVFSKKDKSHL